MLPMRVENLDVKITIPIPINRPDKNGVIYSRKAIENAINKLKNRLPIMYMDNENVPDGAVIGATTDASHTVTWDYDNQLCKVTIDGTIFYGGASLIINEADVCTVKDFEIECIGLSK